MEKKYYRCGCVSHNQGCHGQYKDYLSEIREQRLRRKEKATSSIPFDFEVEKATSLDISEDNEPELQLNTPKKEPALDRIMEINESAEYSTKKGFNSITITVGGKKYYKTLSSKEELQACFTILAGLLE